ncbi:Transposase IS200 like protein [Maioricimonas rarisocia]|uniref:Transposase IS200 like protein n=1 Tax=Maioricimonas rarisocia TaxID=2528026 RepID=A0A517ZDN6_9PLAN|nr:transposase [Maioricimonas rarisocia]QDU40597.1 Transposase IS200 like protein [Maioricimonas rarisocia]
MKHRHRRNYNDPGHAHELTFSCYQGFQFLKAERTCCWLAAAIRDARQELGFDVWAYVFMPEHVHLLVQPREDVYDIAEIRKAIKSPVAMKAIAYIEEHLPEWLPRITRRRGRKCERLFWQSGGGYDRNIVKASTLSTVIDYIHANPVRRRLAERPWEWRWSSAAHFYGVGVSPLQPDPVPPDWTA